MRILESHVARTTKIVILWMFFVPSSVSAQSVDGPDDQRVGRIRQAIGERQFYSSFTKLTPRDFCTRFINDLQAAKNIEFVSPTLRAENFNSPAIGRYSERCPQLELNILYECEPSTFTGLDLKSMKEGEIRQWTKDYCTAYEGTRGYRIYELADLNGTTGESFVFYKNDLVKSRQDSHPQFEKVPSQSGRGVYEVINTRSCHSAAKVIVKDASHYLHLKTPFTFHGLIRYERDYFLLSLSEIDGVRSDANQKPDFHIQLDATIARPAEIKNKTGPLCSSSTIHAKYKFPIPRVQPRKQ